MSLLEGRILDSRYCVIRPLGEGGFGAAYLVEDVRLGRLCVAKASMEHDAEHREQFEAEARILARLSHPNLPQVYDYFFDAEVPYLIMQYIEGDTLDRLGDNRSLPFDVQQVLGWASDLLDALAYLHSQTPLVIHRDIKPPNICITPPGRAVLLDFGIARELDGEGTRGVARSYSWHYSPLEQQLSDPAATEYRTEQDSTASSGGAARTGSFSDIYSLGATLYYALTLVDPPNACVRMAEERLVPIREINPRVPESLANALDRALAVEPRSRCQTPAELRQLLFGDDDERACINHSQTKGGVDEMYTAEISRANPTCFVFLIDQSWSMAEPLAGELGASSKADMSADSVNRLLDTIVGRCTKNDGVRRYFHVGVIGYGATVGPAFGEALAGQELVWIDEIADNVRLVERRRKEYDGAGGLIEVPFQLPIWFEPVASNGTPMCQALWQAHTLLEKWIMEHPTSFPPVVVNITDGAATDGDPYPASEAIRELGTEDGNVLLLNLHLSSTSAKVVPFPDSEDALPDEYARLLFSMSSCLTTGMRAVARRTGYQVSEDARGFVFNAHIEDVVQFLEIGTRGPDR
jgi:serine/threonine protein kinase